MEARPPVDSLTLVESLNIGIVICNINNIQAISIVFIVSIQIYSVIMMITCGSPPSPTC